MITRFAVLPDDRKVLMGLDKNNIFEPGMVYEVLNILDTFMIRKLGPYALPEKGNPSQNSDINTQFYYGYHIMTKDEFDKIIENERKG